MTLRETWISPISVTPLLGSHRSNGATQPALRSPGDTFKNTWSRWGEVPAGPGEKQVLESEELLQNLRLRDNKEAGWSSRDDRLDAQRKTR